MKLYNFFRSGASHRLCIAVNLKGLSYEYVPVDLRKAEHLGAGYRSLNPQGVGARTRAGSCGGSVHSGLAADTRLTRQATLDAAFLANPNCFKSRRPQLPPMPTAAWINPPPEVKKPTREPVGRTLNQCPWVSQSH